MRFLVTGGAGFIGSKVCSLLTAKNHDVTVYDAFIRYLAPRNDRIIDVFSIRSEHQLKGVKVIRGDTRHKADVIRTIEETKPDVVIHLATLPIADLAFDHSEEAIDSILTGTVNLLEAIRDLRVAQRFVYVSSSMVYGDFEFEPATEEHPTNPKEIYGSLKLAGETITRSFCQRYGIEYVIVRPSAVYGPTDQNRRVSQIFLENVFSREKIVLHGGGVNTLDFTYIDDIATGLVLASSHPQAAGEIFNITRGEGRTLNELVDILRQYVPDIVVESEEQALYRPRRGALSIDKARTILGYAPEFSLEEGMARYVTYYQEVAKIEKQLSASWSLKD